MRSVMVDPRDIVAYLLELGDREQPEPELMTHLRVQKLLYYVQGWSLGVQDRRFFDESLEAWQYGPVVTSVYRGLEEYGRCPIPPNAEVGDSSQLSQDQKEFIESIWNGYKKHSAIGLMSKTHSEEPWRRTPQDGIIDESLLAKHFRQCYERNALPGLEHDRVRAAEQDIRNGNTMSFREALEQIEDG